MTIEELQAKFETQFPQLFTKGMLEEEYHPLMLSSKLAATILRKAIDEDDKPKIVAVAEFCNDIAHDAGCINVITVLDEIALGLEGEHPRYYVAFIPYVLTHTRMILDNTISLWKAGNKL